MTSCSANSSMCGSPDLCPEGSLFSPHSEMGSCSQCEPVTMTPPGYYCINGVVELCPAGFFCRNVTATVPVACPDGFICRDGYISPVECDALSSCPAEAATKGPGAGLIGILFLMIFMTFAVLWLIALFRKRRSQTAVSAAAQRQQVSALMAEVVQSVTGTPMVGVRLQGFNEKIKYTNPLSIEFTNLGMKLKSTGAVVLEGVTGEIPAGSMVAVMGGSGAGKSTFLNALANRAPYGEILGGVVLGDIFGSRMGNLGFRGLMGFVPQDDIMHDDLTVYENLMYSARLRLPPSMSIAQQRAIVEDVIEILDLGRIRDNVVGNPEKRGISGGQKKRVNIGMELVAYPRVLFLDEPTSGLDSASCLQITRCLQRMRSLGITVVAVIHQPRWSVFRSFSHCLLLARGGRTVFIGPTKAMQMYFEDLGFSLPPSENAADWFIDIVSGHCVRRNSGAQVDRDFNAEKSLPEIWNQRGLELLASRDLEKKRLTRLGTRQFSSEIQALVFELESSLSLSENDLVESKDLERLCKFYGVDASPDTIAALYEEISNSVSEDEPLTMRSLATTLMKSVIDDLEKAGAAPSALRPSQSTENSENPPRPSFFSQLNTFVSRNLAKLSPLDLCIKCVVAAFAASIVALSTRGELEYSSIPITFQNGLVLFSIVAAASCTYVFGDERLVFSRESQTGFSITAYWLGKNLVNLVDLVIITLYFYTFYFAIFQPDFSFAEGFSVYLLVAWYTSGVAHFFSVTMGPAKGLLVTVMLPCIQITTLGGVNPTMATAGAFQKILFYIGIGYYSIEDITLFEILALPENVQQIPEITYMLSSYLYSVQHLTRNCLISVALGVVVRLLNLSVLLLMVYGLPGTGNFIRLKHRVFHSGTNLSLSN